MGRPGRARRRSTCSRREIPPLPDATVAFFDSTFEEALGLTREARDYLTHVEPRERERMMPNDRMLASCEAMRLTSRLTQVMAWLLVQKAVHAGEMTREEARAPQHRLGGQSVRSEEHTSELQSLMRISYAVFCLKKKNKISRT